MFAISSSRDCRSVVQRDHLTYASTLFACLVSKCSLNFNHCRAQHRTPPAVILDFHRMFLIISDYNRGRDIVNPSFNRTMSQPPTLGPLVQSALNSGSSPLYGENSSNWVCPFLIVAWRLSILNLSVLPP